MPYWFCPTPANQENAVILVSFLKMLLLVNMPLNEASVTGYFFER